MHGSRSIGILYIDKEKDLNKKEWAKLVEMKSKHYLNLGDGGFDENMKAELFAYDFDEMSVTYRFTTQKWQINERGAIHGGAIAGMFDTAFGVVANFTAGENEAATTDMNLSFLRSVEYGMSPCLKVYIVKAGRSLIRLRGELYDPDTGKILAAGSGSWMPL